MKSQVKEKIYRNIFCILAFSSLLFLLGIVAVLFKEALPVFKAVSLKDFLLGKSWYPTFEPPEFGILPLLMASLWVTVGALIVAIPLGVGSALYINEIASFKQKTFLKPLVEILASIPSIVYGFFGVVLVAPFLQKIFNLPVGL